MCGGNEYIIVVANDVPVNHWSAAYTLRSQDTVLTSSVLDLAIWQVKQEYGNGIQILTGNNKEFSTLGELEVTRGLPTCVKESNLREATMRGSFLVARPLLHPIHTHGFMATF